MLVKRNVSASVPISRNVVSASDSKLWRRVRNCIVTTLGVRV